MPLPLRRPFQQQQQRSVWEWEVRASFALLHCAVDRAVEARGSKAAQNLARQVLKYWAARCVSLTRGLRFSPSESSLKCAAITPTCVVAVPET